MYQYNETFYAAFENTTKKAAQIILPHIVERVKPKSAVDFGCGEGVWLRVLKDIDNDVEILGMDGDYVKKEELKIPEECFKACDLSVRVTLEKKYDLAISLEVAEHIAESSADIFVDNITDCADNILFSAAIPGQGGTNHVNEQWQSYWIKKFEERGYFVDFSVRNYFWEVKEITPWRRQNLLFFSKEKKYLLPEAKVCVDVVNPDMFEFRRNQLEELQNFKNSILEKKARYSIIGYGECNSERKVILVGAGDIGRQAYRCFGERVICFADNDKNKVGTEIFGKKVISVEDVPSFCGEYDVVIATVRYQEEIRRQLRHLGIGKVYRFESPMSYKIERALAGKQYRNIALCVTEKRIENYIVLFDLAGFEVKYVASVGDDGLVGEERGGYMVKELESIADFVDCVVFDEEMYCRFEKRNVSKMELTFSLEILNL